MAQLLPRLDGLSGSCQERLTRWQRPAESFVNDRQTEPQAHHEWPLSLLTSPKSGAASSAAQAIGFLLLPMGLGRSCRRQHCLICIVLSPCKLSQIEVADTCMLQGRMTASRLTASTASSGLCRRLRPQGRLQGPPPRRLLPRSGSSCLLTSLLPGSRLRRLARRSSDGRSLQSSRASRLRGQ